MGRREQRLATALPRTAARERLRGAWSSDEVSGRAQASNRQAHCDWRPCVGAERLSRGARGTRASPRTGRPAQWRPPTRPATSRPSCTWSSRASCMPPTSRPRTSGCMAASTAATTWSSEQPRRHVARTCRADPPGFGHASARLAEAWRTALPADTARTCASRRLRLLPPLAPRRTIVTKHLLGLRWMNPNSLVFLRDSPDAGHAHVEFELCEFAAAPRRACDAAPRTARPVAMPQTSMLSCLPCAWP